MSIADSAGNSYTVYSQSGTCACSNTYTQFQGTLTDAGGNSYSPSECRMCPQNCLTCGIDWLCYTCNTSVPDVKMINNLCHSCKTAFGPDCLSCDSSLCLSCTAGLFLNATTSIYNSNKVVPSIACLNCNVIANCVTC